MFNFSPFHVSKHIAIIMLLVCSFKVVLLLPRVKCPLYYKFPIDCSLIHLFKTNARPHVAFWHRFRPVSPRFRPSNQFSLSGKCFVWLFLDPPSIIHIIHDRIVNETDVLLLNCTGDGNPLPKISWSRLPDNITVSKVLKITGKQDEGLYRCIAENGVGNAATKDVYITVLCKSNS